MEIEIAVRKYGRALRAFRHVWRKHARCPDKVGARID